MDPILLNTVAEASDSHHDQGIIDVAEATAAAASADGILAEQEGLLVAGRDEHVTPSSHEGAALLSAPGDAAASSGPHPAEEEEKAGEEEVVEELYEMTVYSEFPEPLTEPQRKMFQRHVAEAVRRHTELHRTSRLIKRGLSSLDRLVSRLRAEQAELQAQVDGTTEAAPAAKAARTETPAEAPAPTPAKRPNRFGGLLRSAAFANMKKVLDTVQKEETEKFGQVAQTRERIARETRLKLVSEDLASQEAILNPLLEKLQRCRSMEQEAESKAAELLELLAEMFIQEVRYATSFTLTAVDASAVAATQASPESAAALPTTSGALEIPFTPAIATPEVDELVRSQVLEVLDGYQFYRARIDAFLAPLEEAERVRKAKRMEDLMQVIGVPDAEVLQASKEAVLGSSATFSGRGELEGVLSSSVKRRPIKAGFGVSDWEDDDDSASDSEDSLDLHLVARHTHPQPAAGAPVSETASDTNPGMKRGRDEDVGGTGSGKVDSAVERDQKDRKLIQSALSALDDFDEVF